ncbi:hypothetical protein JB92DRAFT_1175572 [Gautieria morchelliformis]|nr:hypothetical protein JB92DRAFT_1175572 [Gautieria morchelliformis]
MISYFSSLFSVTIDAACNSYADIILGSAVLSGTGVLLISRIHAVYNCNWKVTGAAVGWLVFSQINAILAYSLAFPGGAALPFGLTGCYLVKKPPYYALICALICNMVLCAFMVHRAWRLFMENRNLPLVKIIIRDCALYFLTKFSALFLNTVIWGLGPPSLSGVAVPWMMAVSGALGSRLSLHTRERYYNELMQ